MSHHSSEVDLEMQKQLRDAAKKMGLDEEAYAANRPGPTGKFPHGKIAPTDEGEARLAVANKDGVVIVDFGKPIAWIGFRAAEADAFIDLLVKHRQQLAGHAPVKKTAAALKEIVADELSKILGSNVHGAALDRRDGRISFEELEANIHLYERLGVAFAALAALKGYSQRSRGFERID